MRRRRAARGPPTGGGGEQRRRVEAARAPPPRVARPQSCGEKAGEREREGGAGADERRGPAPFPRRGPPPPRPLHGPARPGTHVVAREEGGGGGREGRRGGAASSVAPPPLVSCCGPPPRPLHAPARPPATRRGRPHRCATWHATLAALRLPSQNDPANFSSEPRAPEFWKPAWMPNPRHATIASRPCLSSASRRAKTLSSSPDARPSGSNAPPG